MIDTKVEVSRSLQAWLNIAPKTDTKEIFEMVKKEFDVVLRESLDGGYFGVKSIENNSIQLKDSIDYDVTNKYMRATVNSGYGVLLERGGTIHAKSERGMAVPIGTKEQQRATRYPGWKNGPMVWLQSVDIPETKWFSKTAESFIKKWTPEAYLKTTILHKE